MPRFLVCYKGFSCSLECTYKMVNLKGIVNFWNDYTKDWVGHNRDDGTMARPPPGDDVLPFPTVEVQSFWSK
ncbi:hypothetical protein QJS10_CPA03g00974 [Acorus calamus]|uniref:Uncharacterized protein n=1 Tax=Acorus calamus TaxID=4465 RepID=A0AAV9F678_ACOCL|nr:hypothetical protein QJS10_CPA03g00974 [Acorus calamus]